MNFQRLIFKNVFLLLAILFVTVLCGYSLARDIPGDCDPPPYGNKPRIFSGPLATGETVWHKDVNSGCSFSDHNISIDIDIAPTEITDTVIRLTTWDVDYNDPQGCTGGPEVDILWINGNRIGQLQGANNSWSTNTFSFSSSFLVKGSNAIYIDTDEPGTGCWCVGVGYVEIAGKTGFQVISHTPVADQKNVKFDGPGITVEFSSEAKQTTVNANTIILDYRNQAGNWVTVATDIVMISSVKATIVPIVALIDGIRYRMRVLAGPTGVLSKDDVELKSAKEWLFWTMVNLDGATNILFKPNTTKDKMQITWFNVSRNEDLIPKKTAVNRIYANWEPNNDVFDSDEITEFNANIRLDYGGTPATELNYLIKRPDKYSENERKMGKNTINFKHQTGNANPETYLLSIEPVPQTGTPCVFTKKESALVKSQSPKIEFNVWACEMAGWFGGVVPAELTSAKNIFNGGLTYTEQTFPIISCTADDKDTVVSGAAGFNMEYSQTKLSNWWGSDTRFVKSPPGSVSEVEEIRHVMSHLLTLKPAAHKFIAGIVPKDALPGATGCSWNHVILFSDGNFNEGTVAHEIGHEYTLGHNNDNTAIEGFRVATLANKSFVEGNSEFATIASLMHTTIYPTEEQWILPADYRTLTGQFFPAASAALDIEALTGDFITIQGYLDADGNITQVLPMYQVIQRHVPGPTGVGYTVKMFSDENGAGATLGAYDFNAGDITVTKLDGAMVSFPSLVFSFTIPHDDALRSVVITGPKNAVTLNRSDYGIGAPTVVLTAPLDGNTISGEYTVTWNGSDDGPAVYYRLEYSPDSIIWIPITNQMVNTLFYKLNTTLLPTGANQKLAIIAYDGFQTTRKEIGITIDNSVTVKSTNPLNTATDVSEGQTIVAYFVSKMDETTINSSSFKLFEGATQVPGQVIFDSTIQKASFTPNIRLKSNTKYAAQFISGIVKDIYGKTLASDYQWTFTTRTTPVNPQVKNISPQSGQADVPVNTLIQAEFDKDINSSTVVNSSFMLTDDKNNIVTGTVSYSSATKSAYFKPTANLVSNTGYTAVLTTQLADTSGLALESDYEWSFTTGSAQSTGVRVVAVTQDKGQDDNNDGLFDKLVIRVKIEVITTGTYNLNGQLKDKFGKDIAWVSNSAYYSEPGIYFVDIEFNGQDIAGSGVDGPYVLTNVSIYNTSNSSIYYLLTQDYQTYPYAADVFYSVIKLSGIPGIAVGMDSLHQEVLNLETYASHTLYPVTGLNYVILINSNPDVGLTIDSKHLVNIAPKAGFSGYSDVTIEIRDKDGMRDLDTFRISVLQNYKFGNAGWCLISLSNQPAETAINKVLNSISGKYDIVWSYGDGVWKSYNPNQPGFSDLESMESGKGYWINLVQPANFLSMGTSIEKQPISLVTNWNLVGYNSTQSLTSTDSFASIAGRYILVWRYLEDGTWEVYDPNSAGFTTLNTMKPGYGYWIKAIMDTTWILP